jgi:ribonuclease P protein component
VLSAAQRLRRRGDFAAAVRAGRRASRGALVIHLLSPPSPDATPAGGAGIGRDRPARAGFVVPKTVGGAVVRNKVKRRLRHLMRDRLIGLPAGTDIVVRALPGAVDRPYRVLADDLDAALARAGRRRG